MFSLLSAVQLAYAPMFSRLDSETVAAKVKAFSKIIHSIAFPVAFLLAVFSGKIILVLYGPAYQESAGVLALLAVALLFNYLSAVYLLPLLFSGKERLYLICLIAGTVVNIIINVFLIPVFSYTGAAIAALVAHAALYASGFYLFSRAFSLKKSDIRAEVIRTVVLILSFGALYLLVSTIT